MIMVSIISKTHNLRYPNLENWNTVFGTESLHMLVTGIRWLASGACHPRTVCRPRARRPATWFRHGVPDGMFFADGMVFGPQEGDQIIMHSVSGGPLPSSLRAPQIIVGRGFCTGISFSEEVGEVIQCRDSLFSYVEDDL